MKQIFETRSRQLNVGHDTSPARSPERLHPPKPKSEKKKAYLLDLLLRPSSFWEKMKGRMHAFRRVFCNFFDCIGRLTKGPWVPNPNTNRMMLHAFLIEKVDEHPSGCRRENVDNSLERSGERRVHSTEFIHSIDRSSLSNRAQRNRQLEQPRSSDLAHVILHKQILSDTAR
jgi:hypothetical protein